jgi:hypothetical protein
MALFWIAIEKYGNKCGGKRSINVLALCNRALCHSIEHSPAGRGSRLYATAILLGQGEPTTSGLPTFNRPLDRNMDL